MICHSFIVTFILSWAYRSESWNPRKSDSNLNFFLQSLINPIHIENNYARWNCWYCWFFLFIGSTNNMQPSNYFWMPIQKFSNIWRVACSASITLKDGGVIQNLRSIWFSFKTMWEVKLINCYNWQIYLNYPYIHSDHTIPFWVKQQDAEAKEK